MNIKTVSIINEDNGSTLIIEPTKEIIESIESGTLEGVQEDDNYKVIMRGPTLACLIGLHAYSNGVCVNCGKKR